MQVSVSGPIGQRFTCGLREIKRSVYEGGTRAQLFIRWKNHFPVAKTVDRVTAHIDLFPTLLELCGVNAPKGPDMDGRRLKPLLEGKEESWPDRMFYAHGERQQIRNRWIQALSVADASTWSAEQNESSGGRTSATGLRSWFADVMQPDSLKLFPIPVGHKAENPVAMSAPAAILSVNRTSGKTAAGRTTESRTGSLMWIERVGRSKWCELAAMKRRCNIFARRTASGWSWESMWDWQA